MSDTHPLPHQLEHRVSALEGSIARLLVLAEATAAAVLGSNDGVRAGHSEQIRQLGERVSRLERACGWMLTILSTILTAVGGAWALANIHIGNVPPPPGHP